MVGPIMGWKQKIRRSDGKKDFVYDTTSNFEDVALNKEKDSLKRFDKKLKDDDVGNCE